MTEAEWLASTDLYAMYDYFFDATASWKTRWLGRLLRHRFEVSERKIWLFTVACCRRVLLVLPMEEARTCVYLAERFVDGEVPWSEVEEALHHAIRSIPRPRTQAGDAALNALFHMQSGVGCFSQVASYARKCRAWCHVARYATFDSYPERDLGMPDHPDTERIVVEEAAAQAGLFRDIVGNPFRPVRLEPTWLSDTVRDLATSVYTGQAWGRLPIIADALEDAGCSDEALLSHLRGPGSHTRGCWAVDLILGKQ